MKAVNESQHAFGIPSPGAKNCSSQTNVNETGSNLMPEVANTQKKKESFKTCKMCLLFWPFSSFLWSTAINKGSVFLVGTKTSLHLFNHKRDLTDYNCIIGTCCSSPSTHSRAWGKSLILTHEHKWNVMTPFTKTPLLFIWYKAWNSSLKVWSLSMLSIRRFFFFFFANCKIHKKVSSTVEEETIP